MSELLLLFKKFIKQIGTVLFSEFESSEWIFSSKKWYTHTHTYTDIARLFFLERKSAAVQHGHEIYRDRSEIRDLGKTMILKQISRAGPEYCFH